MQIIASLPNDCQPYVRLEVDTRNEALAMTYPLPENSQLAGPKLRELEPAFMVDWIFFDMLYKVRLLSSCAKESIIF